MAIISLVRQVFQSLVMIFPLTRSQLIATRHCSQDLCRLNYERLLIAHGGPLAQLTVRAVPEADLAYCQVSVFTGSRSARLGISIIEY